MQMTMRWYGPSDPVRIDYIQQVPNMQGVVSALYDVPVGETWPLDKLLDLRRQVEAHGLTLSVIESIPVHEHIKLGLPDRDEWIVKYQNSVRNMAAAGVHVLCYNFMPVFDWTRTQLDHALPDGSTTLIFRQDDLEQIDLSLGTAGLPGWADAYTGEELQALREQYRDLSDEGLRDNLRYFLQAVVPVADEVGVKMAIHPDDPPWPILGLPRVVSTAADLRAILDAVPSPSNGLTFCTGSLGARGDNDLGAMAHEFAPRIHFLHARNVRRHAERDFDEVPHVSHYGNIRLAEVVMTLEQLRPDIPFRPDHGRMIWGETGKAGYGLHDRALGATYLQGLIDATRTRETNHHNP